MTLNPELFRDFPRDTFIYFRVNPREYVIKVGITKDLNERDSQYSMYHIPTKYHTYSNIRFARYVADKIYEEYMKEICKTFGGVNIDVDDDGHDNHEWFWFNNESSFRHACDTLSAYINSCK